MTTAVAADKLQELNEELLRTPEEFTVHPKLARQLERRRTAMGEGGIDWGHAESLAYASLLVDGIPVRLTGQDVQRGTFAQRHLVLHDVHTGETFTPMQHLDDAAASFEVFNSPLSEYACMGFEYGYSIAATETLVLWEAQYGDFANGAQIVIDQFISSALSKWRETSRLTLLLPHGYEGNGPEHSSARLERFLQLGAQENIRIVNCTTAAQYFHLLRRQALDATARPLVVVTPKGLLRLKDATSTLADLAEGSFQPVIDDAGCRQERGAAPRPLQREGVLRHRRQRGAGGCGRRRRSRASSSSIRSRRTRSLHSSRHTRRSPRSCGRRKSRRTWGRGARSATAWKRPLPACRLRFLGRPWRASPSEGYPTAHLIEQARIAHDALNV